ncbi:MAG: hypothetical protein DDT31_01641 [Syntrophomonadaceae bacterium]|nr:hypothetical protein [Bacillota bacterium]
MVTKIDEVTRERLREVITNGIKNKRGIPGLARDIRKEFSDMSKYRSQLIAKTETAEALGKAFEDRSRAMGVTGKEWIDSGDGKVSDGCLANAAARVIPIDEPFPSGDMRHPRFPGCRCAVIPVMI